MDVKTTFTVCQELDSIANSAKYLFNKATALSEKLKADLQRDQDSIRVINSTQDAFVLVENKPVSLKAVEWLKN